MRNFSKLSLGVLLCSIFVLAIQSGQALSANVLEKAVEAAEPCRSLKVDILVGSIGVDKFGGARIGKLEIVVERDIASAKATASLTCKTSDAALAPGDASATFELDTEINLATCEVGRLEFRITETGGTYGDVIDFFKEDIAQALRAKIADKLAKSCT